MRRLAAVALRLAGVLLVAAPLALVAGGCGDQARRVAHVAIVSAGSAVATLHAAHQRAYVAATDALRERLARQGGTLEDYDREARPLDAAFRARSEAIAALTAGLYGAAAIVDAARAGEPGAYRVAAATVLAAIDRALAVLADGGVLAPVPVPRELRDVVGALRLVADATDGGAS